MSTKKTRVLVIGQGPAANTIAIIMKTAGALIKIIKSTDNARAEVTATRCSVVLIAVDTSTDQPALRALYEQLQPFVAVYVVAERTMAAALQHYVTTGALVFCDALAGKAAQLLRRGNWRPLHQTAPVPAGHDKASYQLESISMEDWLSVPANRALLATIEGEMSPADEVAEIALPAIAQPVPVPPVCAIPCKHIAAQFERCRAERAADGADQRALAQLRDINATFRNGLFEQLQQAIRAVENNAHEMTTELLGQTSAELRHEIGRALLHVRIYLGLLAAGLLCVIAAVWR